MNRKPGRNDPCPCGSGKKYKACCMRAQEEPKKVYTPTGQRKFKAKVIDSSLSHALFSQSAGGIPSAAGQTDVMEKLRFRMAEHDYRQSEQPHSAAPASSESIPTERKEPLLSQEGDFHSTKDDFRVEEK